MDDISREAATPAPALGFANLGEVWEEGRELGKVPPMAQNVRFVLTFGHSLPNTKYRYQARLFAYFIISFNPQTPPWGLNSYYSHSEKLTHWPKVTQRVNAGTQAFVLFQMLYVAVEMIVSGEEPGQVGNPAARVYYPRVREVPG